MGFVSNNIDHLMGNQTAEEEAHSAQLGKTADAYSAYRPQVADAQQQAFHQAIQALQPANQTIGQMYGGGAMQNLNGMDQSAARSSQQLQGTQVPQSGPQPEHAGAFSDAVNAVAPTGSASGDKALSLGASTALGGMVTGGIAPLGDLLGWW